MQQHPPEHGLPLVRLTTLGPFVLERLNMQAGHEPTYTTLTSKEVYGRGKVMTMLKILVCQRHRRATRDKLIDLLWTEDEQHEMKDVRGALKTMAVVLRDFLRIGSDESLLITISPSDELMLAGQDAIWVDADAFEALVSQAVRAPAPDALPLWEKAHALAQGEFLADEPYSEWATPRREALHGKMGQCTLALADLYTAHNLLDLAQEVLWNAATADYPDEDALCRLLILLEQQERYDAALHLYRNAKNECKKDERRLSPRVSTLARRIRGKVEVLEPYAPLHLLAPVSSATSVSEVSFPAWEFEPSVSGLFLPVASSMPTGTEDCMVWFSERVARVIAFVAQWRRKLFFVDLQTMLDRELKMFDDVKSLFDAGDYTLSRRNALLMIAALPAGLLSTIEQPKPTFINGEFLSSCVASITACWHLLNGKDLASIEPTLAGYLPLLTKWARQPSSYQETAAHLAAQGCLLMGFVEHHKLRFQQRATYSKEAVFHARNAGDRALLVKALTLFGQAHYNLKLYDAMLAAHQEAMCFLREVPRVLQSRVLIGLALAHAQHGCVEESLEALSKARFIYTGEVEDVPAFASANDGLFSIILLEGWVRLDLNKCYPQADHSTHAAKALAQIDQFAESTFVPERISLEILNLRAQAEVALGNLDSFYAYTVQGIYGAKQLGSEKRRHEVVTNYRAARHRWPNEPLVQEVADLLL